MTKRASAIIDSASGDLTDALWEMPPGDERTRLIELIQMLSDFQLGPGKWNVAEWAAEMDAEAAAQLATTH